MSEVNVNETNLNEPGSILESLLFVSPQEVKLAKLVKAIGKPKKEVIESLAQLNSQYKEYKRGLMIIQKGDSYQMAASPENSSYVRKLVNTELEGDLSESSLEVLSIIAYRGPLTRMEIELIRGVNSSYTLRLLLMRGLVERLENDEDKRAYKYQITFDFLKKLGLEKIENLPDYEELSKNKKVEEIHANRYANICE